MSNQARVILSATLGPTAIIRDASLNNFNTPRPHPRTRFAAMDSNSRMPVEPAPSTFSYVLSFLLVGVAWGFTTPFIRRAAADFNARQEKQPGNTSSNRGQSQSQSNSPIQPGLDTVAEEQGLQQENEGIRRRTGNQQGQNSNGNSEQEEEDNTHTPMWQESPSEQSWLRVKLFSVFWTVVNLLRTPAYSIPLVVNLTGSVWFFLLVGKHGMVLSLSISV